MKTILCFVMAILLHNTAYARFDDFKLDAYDERLWQGVISPYLNEPLWNSQNIYDAGHYLMVPLHAAFLLENLSWQRQFHDHFGRFMDAYPHGMESGVKQRLNRLHYFYLASRYLVLSRLTQNQGSIPVGLPSIILKEVEQLWIRDPAWQWGRTPFPGGIRARVLWKLKNRDVKLSYYRAIIDEELFLFAVAADLVTYSHLTGVKPTAFLLELLDIAKLIFEKEVVWHDHGGWLFQPGVWTQHPDYAFAGQQKKVNGMAPLPLVDIAWDSSHSHRFPLWLSSLEMASSFDPERAAFYQRLKRGLGKQLTEKVLVPPSEDFTSWRLTNYMDGRNGLYRWRPGDEFGYGPYELSGTFLIGWWAFLGTERIEKVYSDIANRFPLPGNVVSAYVGPNTSRKRHPFLALPAQYQNGFAELLVRLASKLPPLSLKNN